MKEYTCSILKWMLPAKASLKDVLEYGEFFQLNCC